MGKYTPDQWEALMAGLADADEMQSCVVKIGESAFNALVAFTPEQKRLGMSFRNFDGFDAMLFVEVKPVSLGFQNGDVEIDLAVLLFDEESVLIESFILEANDARVTHPASSSYSWALELPAHYIDLTGDLSVSFSR